MSTKVVLASITQNLVLKCSFCNLQDRAQVKSSQEPKMNRSRGWCFTLNNYSVERKPSVMLHARICCSEERGDEGTPHLQGYVHFKNEKEFEAAQGVDAKGTCRGSQRNYQQAIEYCQKEGDWEEHGEETKRCPRKKEKEKRKGGAESLRRRKGDEDWLKENEPNVAFKHMATFAVTRRLRKNRSTTLILRMNGGSVQPELASPRRYGKSTQLTMLKRRTSGGATTRDKTRS